MQSEPTPETHASPPSVLVAEDEVLIRLAVSEYLRECGFEVFEAASADEARSILQSGLEPDVLFTDVQMPGELDGFGLARWARQRFPNLTIITTSGVARMAEDAADLCEQADFVAKPYDPSLLAERIKARLAARERG